MMSEQMTTNRALDILIMSEQACWDNGIDSIDVDKAVETIRKALEQEPIIDKIRAEVMALRNIRAEEFDIDSDVFDDRVILRSGVLDIIDRYKTEGEVKE